MRAATAARPILVTIVAASAAFRADSELQDTAELLQQFRNREESGGVNVFADPESGETSLKWPTAELRAELGTEAPTELRAMQRCFRPKVVQVGSLGRTGAPFLAHIVAVFLTLADPDFDMGGHSPLALAPKPDKGYFSRIRDAKVAAQAVSGLVKVRNPLGWVQNASDIVLMSHRRPSDLLSTMMINDDDGSDPSRYNTAIKTGCQRLMQYQEVMNEAARICCGGVALDLAYENLERPTPETLRAIALALGICEEGLGGQVLDFVAQAHARSRVNGTFAQPEQGRAQSLRSLVGRMVAESPKCQAWEERVGSWELGQWPWLKKRERKKLSDFIPAR